MGGAAAHYRQLHASTPLAAAARPLADVGCGAALTLLHAPIFSPLATPRALIAALF